MQSVRPDFEQELHAALTLWAQDHAARFPDVDVLPYDPAAYPEQRLATFKTPVDERVMRLPPAELHDALGAHYRAGLGDAGRVVLEELNRTGSNGAGEERSLTASVADLLDRGRSVALLSPHADRLEDIGAVSAGLAVALDDASRIRRNGLILNKVMTRELYRGQPMLERFNPFGNVYWVIPETEASRRWGVPPRVKEYVNLNAMRALVGDLRSGAVVTFAPTGTVMRRTVDASGEPTALHVPPIPRVSARLISRFDAYAIVVVWRDVIRVGPLTPIDPAHRDRREGTATLTRDVLAAMSALTAEVAGVPVIPSSEPVVE